MIQEGNQLPCCSFHYLQCAVPVDFLKYQNVTYVVNADLIAFQVIICSMSAGFLNMDTLDASNEQTRKHKIESREHTIEEKRKQRKEWKKRKRRAGKRAKSGRSGDNVSTMPVKDCQDTVFISQRVTRSRNPVKQVPAKADCHSRGALMVRLAVDNSEVKNNPKKRFKTAHNEVNISHGQPHSGHMYNSHYLFLLGREILKLLKNNLF